jgi:hypothetical protein
LFRSAYGVIAMQPALACPSIGSSPPPWTAALLPLDWRMIVFPLLAAPLCVGLSAILVRGMPEETRRKMLPWVVAAGSLVFIDICAMIFAIIVGSRWSDMVLQWSVQVSVSPGFLPCQDDAATSAYYQSSLIPVTGVGISLFVLQIAALLERPARAIRRAYLATYRSPDIPDVPDDLAARRAIIHRPYRRGAARSRWRLGR